MSDMLTVSNGVIRKAEDVLFADEVLNTKGQKGLWPTIELLMKYWVSKAPEEVKAFKVQVEDTRSDLRDRKYGTTRGDKNMERRLTIVFPQALHNLIRAVYKADELKLDKLFFNEFAKRYPAFKVPEKL